MSGLTVGRAARQPKGVVDIDRGIRPRFCNFGNVFRTRSLSDRVVSLADRYDVLSILSVLFGLMSALAVLLALQISLTLELFAIYGLALLSGAAAAAVIKLIPMYFVHVGAVSGLAKAAGTACGFTMTAILAGSKFLMGGYTLGFAIWALMNIAAFYVSFSRVGFRSAKPVHEIAESVPAH